MNEYLAVSMTPAEFAKRYPDAVGEPVGGGGLAFGSAPIALGERLLRPDFQGTGRMYVVLVDDDLYLAFAALGEPQEYYPPAHIRVKVTDWGSTAAAEVVESLEEEAENHRGVVLPDWVLKPDND